MIAKKRSPRKQPSSKRRPFAAYFNEVEVSAPGSVYLTSHLHAWDEAGEERTRIVKYDNGEWFHVDDIKGIVHSLCLATRPKRVLWALARHGDARSFSNDGVKDEEVLPDILNGYVFRMRQLGSTMYACGGQHMVLRREKGRWVHHDEGLFTPAVEGNIDRSFFDMEGTGEGDIYCVGGGGAVAHFDGQQWTLLESPTNYNLYRVLCRSPEEVYFCGNGGTLFRGHRDGWESLGLSDPEQTLYGMAWFRDRLYVCSTQGLWRLEGDVLEPVELGLKGEVSYYRLAASDQELWATSGAECIYRFDGHRWERLVSPDNAPP